MAQAGSAQREPSMEEILASIRRIIEDSDTGRKPGDEPEPSRYDFSTARHEPAVVEPADPAESPVIEVDAFRAELRAGHPASEPKKPVTLAEVQAQIAREAPRKSWADAPAASLAAEAPEVAAIAPQEHPAASVEQAQTRDVEEPRAEQDETMDAVFEDISAEQFLPATPAEAPQPAEGNFAKPAIISEHAGRQVAAAFGELSEAFAARSKKTFDDMAEEMMRPMLQDWLDNNLPILVERLVREEIERVARGAA